MQKKHFPANFFACFPFGIHNWTHVFRWAVNIHVLELFSVQLHSICCFIDISIMRRCTHSCNLSLLMPSSVLLLSSQVIFCHCETYWGLWGQIKTHQILLLVLFKQVNGIMPVSLTKQIKACIVNDLSIKYKKEFLVHSVNKLTSSYKWLELTSTTGSNKIHVSFVAA